MKLFKSQLKQIIKEELSKLLREQQQDWRTNKMVDSLVAHLENENLNVEMDLDEATDWLVKTHNLPSNPPPHDDLDAVFNDARLNDFWDPIEGLLRTK